jgi:hypothetical protein
VDKSDGLLWFLFLDFPRGQFFKFQCFSVCLRAPLIIILNILAKFE